MEKTLIGKIESTNNKLENYFDNPQDKHAKEFTEPLKEY